MKYTSFDIVFISVTERASFTTIKLLTKAYFVLHI